MVRKGSSHSTHRDDVLRFPRLAGATGLHLSENARALFFIGRTGAASTAALKGITARFRQPDDCCPRTRHVWGTKAKPLAAYRQRLCCLCRQPALIPVVPAVPVMMVVMMMVVRVIGVVM